MAVEFTKEQQKVIDLRDRNILVSAAAGSGKTAVLVERIIQMILDEKKPVDIDRLLVVTFTNAAAAEMRERIGRAIDRKLEQQPDNAHLQKQAALLHNAQITTIDSFCLFVIRNNFNDIGLDPGFRVADEGELKLMKQDVLTELLESKYGEKDEHFLDCVEYFTGGSNDRALEEYIEKLYEFSMSNPWPEDWLFERKKDYDVQTEAEMEENSFCRYLVNYVKVCLKECADSLSKGIALTLRPDGPYFYGVLLEKEREMLEKASQQESFEALASAFDAMRFDRLPSKKDETVDPDCRELVKQLRNEVKKQIQDLKEDCFPLSCAQVLKRMHMAKRSAETLIDLVLLFKKMLDEKKRRENVIDFHDMEHFALNILLKKDEESGQYEATAAAREYRQFFQEILIDEYQDSNLVQELLLQSISGEEEGRFNRFMVGDVKQSIYKFRLARPELFIEKYNCYTKVDSCRQRIDLHKNFRSRKKVIDSVNSLFCRIMGQNFGGIEYDDDASLYPGAVYPENDQDGTEILLVEKDKESSLSAREQEALVIADRINRLIREAKVTDKETGSLRPVRYGDIVILLRTASGWAEDFKKIFEKEGIPAYVSSRTGYFQAAEVRELMQLLRVLNNPLQDIPLFGTMKSFFGGFTEEEIAWIRSTAPSGDSLYENLKAFAEDKAEKQKKTDAIDEEKIKFKINKLLCSIENWRTLATYTPIHNLIREILTQTGYLEYISAKPGGEQRRANVEMLLVRAAAFENTSYYGLFHFLHYIEQLGKYEIDYGEADTLDENADVVRIMSIHKSKGLEFPVCFVAGLSKKFNLQDTTGCLIADVDMGIGVDCIDSGRRVRSSTLRKNVISMKLKLDSLSEEMRILYVAMTRAREKLILTASVPDVEKVKSEIMKNRVLFGTGPDEKLPFSVLAGAGSYLDFILPCVEESDITFVTSGDRVITGVEETLRIGRLRQELRLTPADSTLLEKLTKKFAREYPYECLSGLFVKTTVSELKKAAMEPEGDSYTKVLYEEPEVVPYLPAFVKEKEGLSATDRGSAYHKVMELLDFKAFYRLWQVSGIEDEPKNAEFDALIRQELERQLDEMEKSEKLSGEWREAVALPKVIAFLKSDLAKRMMAAAMKDKLYREQPFVLGLSANRLKESFPESEMVLIQGIIDVFFEEENHIVLADYKTDRVREPEELTEKYKVQLDYYEEALERLTGKRVCEKLIYSFALSSEITLDKTAR